MRDSDKIIYEKLKDYKADYNSADWEQMEAMLPQQRSRKPFYYSMAAVLLLLLGSVGLWVGTEGVRNESGSSGSAVVQQQLNQSTAVTSIGSDNAVLGKNEQVAGGQQQVGSADQSLSTVAKSVPERSQKQDVIPVITEQVAHEKVFGKEASAENSSMQLTAQEQRQLVARTYEKGGVKKREEVIQKTSSGVAESANASVNSGGSAYITSEEAVSGSEEEMLASAVITTKTSSEANSTAFTGHGIGTESFSSVIAGSGVVERYHPGTGEPVWALNSIESGMIQIDGEATGIPAVKSALNGDAILAKKPKKQIVSLVMGAGAGMNFSFTDPALMTKPGYSIDLAEELMFVKRIGIALTQSYTDRRYDGGAFPCPDGVQNCPYSYSSTVKSMDFGIDIKANLVNKTRWSWYVKAGVINTVKIKELFTYHYPQIDTVTPPPTLPPQNNFNGGTMEMTFDSGFGLSINDAKETPDLTISGDKRYHIAYHAATGVDIAMNPRMKVQFEAGHCFTQPIVGEANNRLQSFGVNSKLLFRLSK